MKKDLPKISILGVDITVSSESEILEYIMERVKKRDKKIFVTTPNPEIITFAIKHPKFKTVLNSSDLALPDGVGVVIAGMLLGKGSMQRIAGTDMVEKLCFLLSKRLGTAGFFGGLGTVAEDTADRLKMKYPSLKVGYASDIWDPKLLKAKSIDVLFVALGFPKQEEWIYENLNTLPATVIVGVGGAFDFISGKVSRAPRLIQNMGLEWFYRLLRQPWRIKRQTALPIFTYNILKEALKSHSRREKEESLN